MKKYCTKNTANIHYSTIDNYQQLWFLMYRCNICPTLCVIFSAIIFNNINVEISNIYFIINKHLILEFNFHWWIIKSQRFMLTYPVLHGILIGTHKQKTLQVFMLTDGVYITWSMKWVEVKEKPSFNVSLTNKNNASTKKYARNIAKSYVQMFGNSKQFWLLIYRWNI